MTFLTDVMKKGYSEDEIFAVLLESDQERKRRRVLAKVIQTVEAHRLQKMKDLLALEKLATWRRMNGFDRVVDGEDSWFHGTRSLPLTPQESAKSLWYEVNTLKDAISMPSQKVSNLINAIEQGKVSDEKFAMLKRLVEKRGRKAAQVTVTPVDTVQYCSPSPQTPEQSSNVFWRTARGGWTQSKASSNHHRLARILKRPDSSVPRTRGRGRKDEPSLTAICSLAWDRTKGETFLHLRWDVWTRESSELRRTSLFCSRTSNPKTGERQRRKRTVRPWWRRRRAATAMERGCNGSLFFSSRERWAWGARC